MPKDGGLKLTDAELAAAFADPHWAKAFPPILTVQQTADLLQVPRATVYDWSSRGRLKGCARKVGKHLRIYRDKLLRTIFEEGLTAHES
jgi:excisionase family DNA binding protein